MAVRAISSASIGLCLLTATLAWWRLGDSIDPERAGLTLTAHYAPIPDQQGVLRLGASSTDDVVLPDFSTTDAARLMVDRGTWKLTPGASGQAEGGASLAVPGRYSLSLGHRQVRMELNNAIEIEIRGQGSKSSITFINSKPGNSRDLPEINANLISSADGVSVFRDGQIHLLKKNDHISIGDTTLKWMKQEQSKTPLALTISEDPGSPTEQLVWPGSSLYFPDEQLLMTVSGGRSRPVRLSSTNPNPELMVFPDVGNLGISTGSPADSLGVGSKHYRLVMLKRTNDTVLAATDLVVLLRSPEGFNPWKFFWGGSVQSWNDPAVYRPYTFIPVAACGTAAPSTAIWVTRVSSNPATQNPNPALEDGPLVSARYSLISLMPPAWMNQTARTTPIVVCTSGSEFHITSLAGDGSAVPAPLDGILGAHDKALRPPNGETPTIASSGDAIFYAGRVYLLTDARIPSALKLFAGLTPFVFVVTAMPLAWILSNRLAVQWAQLPRTESGIDWNRIFRLGPILAPTIGLAAIVGMMTVGGYFQLRLATSSQLAGHAKYYNVFLTSCVEALAVTTILVKWLDTRWTGAGLARAISAGCLSLGLGAVMLLWVEPALYHWLAASNQPALAVSQQSPGFGWLIPGLFFLLAAMAYRLPAFWSRGSMDQGNAIHAEGTSASQGSLRKLATWVSDKWSWFQKTLVRHYYSSYQKIRPPSLLRSSFNPSWVARALGSGPHSIYLARPLFYLFELARYFFWLLFFYVSWAIFPGCRFLRSECPDHFQWKWTPRRIAKILFVYVLCELPVAGVIVLAKSNPQVANLGKQALPPLLVLWAAWILGRVGLYAQNAQRDLRNSAGKPRPLSVLIMLLCALVFAAGMFLLPRFFNWIYDPRAMAATRFAIVLICIAIWLLPEWKVSGIMLFHVLPFFGVLFLISLVFNDYGALLVWTWTLSWIGAWALMLNVLLADPRKVWNVGIGNLLSSLVLLSLPLTILGTFNRLAGESNAFAGALDMSRALSRFRLAAAPFYYDAGEWLANVQLMAVGEKNVHWIPNLNSDVALNGLHYFLPREHYLFAGLFFLLILLLAAAFGEMFRYAVRSTSLVESTEYLQAALITATAFFGIGMLLFVHLGASLFDILPLTGVPCPWLSHSLVAHIVMTSLIMGVLVFASGCALRERGSHA